MELGGLFVVEGADEAAGGFWRGVVELTSLDAAEIAGVADAVTDIDRGRLESDVAALSDRLPTVGTKLQKNWGQACDFAIRSCLSRV